MSEEREEREERGRERLGGEGEVRWRGEMGRWERC
jgi:hypothetical protein